MGWEYQTVQFDFTAGKIFTAGGEFNCQAFTHELNRLGWDGWELVNVFDTNRGEGRTKYVIAVLKRPLNEDRRQQLASAGR